MSIRVLDLQKIVFTVVLLAMSITLVAQQKSAEQKAQQQPSDQEQAMVQRLYETQMNGSDSDFYEAHEAFMDYLEGRQNWAMFYRTWMNRVIYDVNHKYFHRAFAEINYITDDTSVH